MLHLHVTRNKIFRRHEGDREQVVQCARNTVTKVPDWVKDDPGYKMGLKDKSIVDLTPPAGAKPFASVDYEKAALFLQARGYAIDTAEGAKVFIEKLDEQQRAGFFAELLSFDPSNQSSDDKADGDGGEESADAGNDGDEPAQDENAESPADAGEEAGNEQPASGKASTKQKARPNVPKGLQGGSTVIKTR